MTLNQINGAMFENACRGDQPGHARAAVETDQRGLVPQSHGGALRLPFTPGAGAAAARSPWRKTRRLAMDLAHEATPAAMQTLIDLLQSEDPRVRAISADQILNRSLGKPSEVPPGDDAPVLARRASLRYLTAEERERLRDALFTVSTFVNLARQREAGAVAAPAEPMENPA